MNIQDPVIVVGAGLAGSECAWALAQHHNCAVHLYEMKSVQPTPAQSSPHLFAELVCSNTFKSKSDLHPSGLLKEEMIRLGSLIVPTAQLCAVPAGDALAVDREAFSTIVTKTLKNHKNIRVFETEVQSLEDLQKVYPHCPIVVATGPLTSDTLAQDLQRITGQESLYFYDAIAPIVDGNSLDRSVIFQANRYQDSSGDYLNIPLNKEDYFECVRKILAADKLPYHSFEEPRFFNGCQPVEALAEKGPLTLAFGPLRPTGLRDPQTGLRPFAVIQLRLEKLGDSAYNMVGFQTRMTWPSQRAVLRSLPGCSQMEFFRLGSMHRNTYMISPVVLNPDFSLKNRLNVHLAGQIMGVEGYLESAAMGLYVGHTVGQKMNRQPIWPLPSAHCAFGALIRFLFQGDPRHFSPMNAHWGLFDALEKGKISKEQKRRLLADRAKESFSQWLAQGHTSYEHLGIKSCDTDQLYTVG